MVERVPGVWSIYELSNKRIKNI